jgi:hypothetical protein
MNMTINTTKLPLPEVMINSPDILSTYTPRIVNLEAYAKLPTCDEIPDLTSYLGYSLGTLFYEWR